MLSPALASHLLDWRKPARGWLAAVMLFLLALVVQTELAGILANRPLLAFVPAVLLATLLGGWAPGAAVALGGAAAAWVLFLHGDGGGMAASLMRVAMFLLLAAVLIALLEMLVRAAGAFARERRRAALLAETHRTMLQEMQHRIANQMQFVAGALALQSHGIAEAGAQTALQDAARRLDTLGRIHRLLCDPHAAEAGFSPLVREISQDLLTAAGAENIVCVVDVAPITLEPERMTSLALIVTELLTNALRHAFVGRRHGTIAITLRAPEPGRCLLEVRDDGVGMEPAATPAGLGQRILHALAERLGGEISYREENGTVARVDFPAPA
jgi:two-component sensor histidine kinase